MDRLFVLKRPDKNRKAKRNKEKLRGYRFWFYGMIDEVRAEDQKFKIRRTVNMQTCFPKRTQKED